MRGEEVLRKHGSMFVVFDRGPPACVLLQNCHLTFTPTNPMNCFGQLLGDANSRYFPRPVCAGWNWTLCPLSCHLGLAPASVLLGAVCCPEGLLCLRGGEHKWTLGLENLCMSRVTLVCSGKGVFCQKRFLPRLLDTEKEKR